MESSGAVCARGAGARPGGACRGLWQVQGGSGLPGKAGLFAAALAGRPTPLYEAGRLSELQGGARIYLKREDLLHTGAHKINNALGQGLLARKMGKRRIVAETGAGQHGVAVAAVCALLGLECVVYMGAEDVSRQSPNVKRMQLLGAEVKTVTGGSRTLKDAINEAIRDWVTNVHNTYYLLGSAVGPHPYPLMVREFQAVIGQEAREQVLALRGALPDYVVACVGGGSNAIGIFYPFLGDKQVKLVGVEAGGEGLASGKHAATLQAGRVGVLHGAKSFLLQDEAGQIRPTHSISAGLDYPGVGPEHSYLKSSGRAQYTVVEDRDALKLSCCSARQRDYSGAGVCPRRCLCPQAGRRPWTGAGCGRQPLRPGDKDMGSESVMEVGL